MSNGEDQYSKARAQAELLVKENKQAEPQIVKVYWFPHQTEVRIIELVPSVPTSSEGSVQPVYFQASPKEDLPLESGIAMIRPEEYAKLSLPPDWGQWDDAIELNLP